MNNALSRVNGSSETGHCSSVSHGVVRSTCTDPTSSVLFDGVIPTLTGLDGDMWASQLLTLQRPMPSINIDITTPISRVEVTMFNCPEWRILVQSISLRDNDGIVIGSSGDLNSITSCDSLVRLCVPAKAINQLALTVQFNLGTDSNWVHLAEVTFYNDSTNCPPNTTITSEMNTTPTNTPPHPTTTTIRTQGMTNASTTPITTTTEMTTTDQDSTDENVIIPVVVVICVVFMIVGIMAAVLIQWRYHKHKTSHHTALGEGHSHAHTHSHPPLVEMCEETGQICYCSPPEALGQLSPSHDTYSHLQRDATHEGEEIGEYSTLSHGNKPQVLRGGASQPSHDTYSHLQRDATHEGEEIGEYSTLSHGNNVKPQVLRGGVSQPLHDTYSHLQRDTSEGRGGAQSEGEYSVVHMKECKEKGEYSVLFHANKPHVLERDKMEAMRTGDSITHVYAQIDGVKKGKKETGSTGVTTHPAAYSSLDMSKSWEMAKPDTHLYDQVDKRKNGEVATHPHTPETDTAVDHFYAVLEDNREKKKGEVATHLHTPEADTAVDHFYADEGEVATHLNKTDLLYARVDKKKISKKNATHPDTPETDNAVDHFYAVLEDNCEGKKGEVATHPHTPETDTAVDQLCAQVDKNQKEKEVSVPLQESGPVYSALNKPSPPQLPAKSDLLMEDPQTP